MGFKWNDRMDVGNQDTDHTEKDDQQEEKDHNETDQKNTKQDQDSNTEGDAKDAKEEQQQSDNQVTEEEVQAALDIVRPSIQADGGNVVLDEITDDNVIKVQLVGACAGCPMSTMTLKQGVEKTLKEEIPAIKKVEAV